MFVVDTNIFIYAANEQAAEYGKCRDLILEWRSRSEPWYLTWSIVYEFLRVATHPNVFSRPLSSKEAWAFIEAVLAAPNIDFLIETERHLQVAQDVFGQISAMTGNLVFDARTAILMREHGVTRIYTRDADFHRFPFLDVVDPLQ